MKKLLLTGAMLIALAGAVFAQGRFYLNTGSDANYVTVNAAGSANAYSGTFGIEVYLYAASGTMPTATANAINTLDQTSGVGAYSMMKADFGFTTPEVTLVNQTMGTGVNKGTLLIASAVTLPDDPGGLVTVALAMWNNNQTSWANMLANATSATRAGVTVFNQSTQLVPTAPPNITTFNSYDLVMTPVPEPGTFALAGLGAAALVIFRRRK